MSRGPRLHLLIYPMMFIGLSAGCGITVTGNPKGPDTSTDSQPNPQQNMDPLSPPPKESIEFDFSLFPQQLKKSLELLKENSLPGSNFAIAAVTLGATQVSVLGLTVVPAVSLATAAKQEPEQINKNTWAWQFDVTIFDANYSEKLVGQRQGDEKSWELTLSRDPLDTHGCCKEFIWMQGVQTNNTGTWTIFDPERPNEAAEKATLKWSIESTGDVILKLTNHLGKPDHGIQPGAYVIFQTLAEERKIVVSRNPTDDKTFEVRWNKKTLAGTLVTEDETKLCWDENKQNIDCF